MSGPTPVTPVAANFYKDARPTWHQRRRHAAVRRLLRGRGGKLLDYGCGYGDLTYAVSRTFDVHGVDVDPERVAFARREYAPLPFDVCPSNELQFADGSFDVVLSVVVIHFTTDPVAHLREARRVLRPGGHLLLGFKEGSHVRDALRRVVGRPPAGSALWSVPRREMLEIVGGEGFELVAQTFFYDPPGTSLKSAADVVVTGAELLLSLLRVQATAPYHVILARKR